MLEEREKEREIKEKNLKKSIKHRSPESGVLVNVEWPAETLAKTAAWSDKELEEVPIQNMSDSMLSYKLDKEIGYGCLKGGLKKTYKNISSSKGTGGSSGTSNNTRHTHTVSANRVKFATNINSSEPMVSAVVPMPVLMQTPPPMLMPAPTPMTTPMATPTTPIVIPASIPSAIPPANITRSVHLEEDIPEPEYVPPQIKVETPQSMVPVEIEPPPEMVGGGEHVDTSSVKVPSIKETVKRKTIKHKYTLGKSKTLNNRISVLSTSKSRIKAIQDAKRELQKTSMEKMKKYLMDKNLLSAGSFAPPDVIKKMYEEANITADITNHNESTLLENYLDKH